MTKRQLYSLMSTIYFTGSFCAREKFGEWLLIIAGFTFVIAGFLKGDSNA